MKRQVALLALAATTACGLDAFSWGGGSGCDVRWSMSFEGIDGSDLVRPRVDDVQRLTRHAGNITWRAWFDLVDGPMDFKISNYQLQPVEITDPECRRMVRVSGPCTHGTMPAEDRDRELDTYVCRLDLGFYPLDDIGVPGPDAPLVPPTCERPPELQGARMIFEEVEICAED